MISINEKTDNNEFDFSFENFTSGLNLIVILVSVLIILSIVLLIVFIKYRSKKYKKKNSICDSDTGVYPSVESGVLTAGIPVQLNKSKERSFSETSDSSDDILYESERRYVVDRVQPKRCSLRSQQSISSVDSDMDAIPSVVVSVITDGKSASIALIKASNLKRSGYSSTDNLIPEGVFARIYPKNRFSSDSSQTDGEQRIGNEEYFETGFIKSKKSKQIKFNENEKFIITANNFPIRISVYEMDKQRVRYNIGHCFIDVNTRDNIQTNQLIELDLYSTIYKARNSCLSRKE